MTKIMVFAMIGMTIGFAKAESVSDDEIRDMVVHSGFYIDNAQAARAEFTGAKDLCAGDTNRFARILCELAQTNHARIADRMIGCLGRHGTPAQLPFLYSMATNEQHGVTAVKSILRLEGVTSNSVATASWYLFSTNYRHRARYEICDCLVSQLAKTQSNRTQAERAILRFLSDYNIYHDWLDAAMKRADPTYSQSKRRLGVLRAISLRETDAKDLSYVTNAINELVAYPEADLPD